MLGLTLVALDGAAPRVSVVKANLKFPKTANLEFPSSNVLVVGQPSFCISASSLNTPALRCSRNR